MYILGLNTYHGDASAALLKDGKLICAYEEERFTRFKHWAGLPLISIRACLTDAEISIQDIDHITISRDPSVNKRQKILFVLKNRIKIKALIHRSKHISKVGTIGKDIAEEFGLKEKELKPEVHYLEHHCTHMASSFFASPFEDAAILSIDGFGDFCSTKTGIGNDNKMKVLDAVLFPHSVGIFYTALTQYLGFNHYGDEYKVMGLAPYGKPKFLTEMEKIIMPKSNGLFQLGLDYFVHHRAGVETNILLNNDPTPSRIFSDNLIDLLGPLRKKEEKLEELHLNIAASVQVMTENIIFHMLNHLQEKTKMENICIAGGVAQNSVANGKILQETAFKRIYIPSASHDAGTSYGSAIYYHNQVLGNKRADPVFNAYTGSKFTDEEIQVLLDKKGIDYKVYDDIDLYDVVSQKIVDGGVIGWFQGRAEFGPRALGHRSILVDPRRTDAKDLLNEKIKRRESFRPFAPSILKEHVDEYFELNDNVPFMEKVFPIRKEKREVIPAVTHVDGTGRLHTVEKGERYYSLIDAFYRKTGVPVVLNTSFNENEPIVNDPLQALDCFTRTKMDMLVLGNNVITR